MISISTKITVTGDIWGVFRQCDPNLPINNNPPSHCCSDNSRRQEFNPRITNHKKKLKLQLFTMEKENMVKEKLETSSFHLKFKKTWNTTEKVWHFFLKWKAEIAIHLMFQLVEFPRTADRIREHWGLSRVRLYSFQLHLPVESSVVVVHISFGINIPLLWHLTLQPENRQREVTTPIKCWYSP